MATTDDMVQRLCAALRADTQAQLVDLLPDLQRHRVAVAALATTLGESGRADLRRLLRYAENVRKTGSGTLRMRLRGQPVAAQVRPWTNAQIEELRGRLIGLIDLAFGGGKNQNSPPPGKPGTRDQSQSLETQALALVDLFEDPTSSDYRPGWTHKDVAGVLGVSRSALNGRQRDKSYRLPDYMRRYTKHREGAEVRRRSAQERNT